MNGRKILRIAIAIAVATAISALTASTAEAICQNSGKDNYRRLVVAQSADIFFTAGVPSTRFINDVFVTGPAVHPGEVTAWRERASAQRIVDLGVGATIPHAAMTRDRREAQLNTGAGTIR